MKAAAEQSDVGATADGAAGGADPVHVWIGVVGEVRRRSGQKVQRVDRDAKRLRPAREGARGGRAAAQLEEGAHASSMRRQRPLPDPHLLVAKPAAERGAAVVERVHSIAEECHHGAASHRTAGGVHAHNVLVVVGVGQRGGRRDKVVAVEGKGELDGHRWIGWRETHGGRQACDRRHAPRGLPTKLDFVRLTADKHGRSSRVRRKD